MSKELDLSNQFVVMWCREGLETVVPVTEIEKQVCYNALIGKPVGKSVMQIINMLTLRARFNGQRNYEIYAISAVDGITKEDIEEMFANAPQVAADTIRRIGFKIFSDRCTSKDVIK